MVGPPFRQRPLAGVLCPTRLAGSSPSSTFVFARPKPAARACFARAALDRSPDGGAPRAALLGTRWLSCTPRSRS